MTPEVTDEVSKSHKYDKSSLGSIYEFALRLTGKTLAEMVSLPEGVTNKRNRGDLGTLVEKYYFEHKPPTNLGPDFPDADLLYVYTVRIKYLRILSTKYSLNAYKISKLTPCGR